MSTETVITVLGGLALLLLGMKLMTDGLKLAGGAMLRDILRSSTKTKLRGLGSGFAITALVQSSSAVTVAAIGFVNAGLMNLGQAVWVIYGSNVGTTVTAWIVAFLGLNINVKALALPILAVGTALWLSGRMNRRAALGEALAGFGIFFLGIETLQSAFGGLETGMFFQGAYATGVTGMLLFVAVGFGLTCVTQSSSAAMALILTATASGLVPLAAGAAGVIGANVGTTSTAVLAVIGATPNAKRLAALHVAFNLITGVVAVLLVPLLLAGILGIRHVLGFDGEVASVLALFHTTFNILGVLVLWPLTKPLVRSVSNRFRTAEEDEATPRYLDSTVVRTPGLALNAMIMETGRIGEVAMRMARTALTCHPKPCREMVVDKSILDSLQLALGEFSANASREGLLQRSATGIPNILRVSQYFNAAGEMAVDADAIQVGLGRPDDEKLQELMDDVRDRGEKCVLHADATDHSFSRSTLTVYVDRFEQSYQALKAELLEAGSAGRIDTDLMVGLLDHFSRIRRMVEQVAKGASLLHTLRKEAEVIDDSPS